MAAAGERAGKMLDLTLIGGITIAADGAPVELKNRKARALLLLLALSPNRTSSRERTYGMLWPNSSVKKAQNSLRSELATTSGVLEQAGCAALRRERTELSLDPDLCRVDTDSLRQAVEPGADIPEIMLSRARIADEIGVGFEDLLGDWIYVRRQEIHNELARGLEARLEAETGDEPRIRAIARALFTLDPTHEIACQALMRSHARAGNRSAALQIYSELWRELESEHDEEPSDTTQELYLAIKTKEFTEIAPPASPAPAPASPAPVAGPAHQPIALYLPPPDTELLTDDQRRLALGLYRELTGSLIKFREWRVHTQMPAEIEHGNTDYVLWTTFSDDGPSVALSFTLSLLDQSQIIWGETELIAARAPFSFQNRVIRRLAGSLSHYMSADRLTRFHARGDVDLDSYDRWLRSQELFESYQGKSWQRAEEILASIIARDPDFSRAYSSMAQLENSRHLAVPGFRRTEESRRRALEFSDAAVQIDPLDARAHLSRAWSLSMAGRYQQVEAVFESAVRLNRNDPWTLISSALGMAFVDQLDVARELLEQAMDAGLADKPVHTAYIGTLNFLLGDFRSCVSAVDRAGTAIHNLPGWKTAALVQMGDTVGAERTASEFVTQTAQRWQAAEAADARTVGEWFLHCFPLRNRDVWERLRYGLLAAGLDVADAEPPLPGETGD